VFKENRISDRLAICEVCQKGEDYHICLKCEKHLCINCFNTFHFGIGAPRAGKSMVYNKCIFCDATYAANAKCSVCDKCEIILTWKSSMNYLGAVNRVTELVRTGRLDSKLKNENYCKTNFGVHAAQVIMDAIDSSTQ
jgi:hypothetical protein